MKKRLKFFQAINLAIDQSMKKDKKVNCFGLGVTDPKGVFGTTLNLEKKYGKDRVFDVPTSENAITGIGIGLSLTGDKSIMVHQRLDFFLLAMDQLVNSAAKYYFMFGKKISVPITIRLIIGRGWGQGPTHSQCLHSWFAHIPGLKVVMPSNAEEAYQLLIQSIFDPNPVIFIEHRWLYENISEININQVDKLRKKKFNISPKVKRKGKDVTIVSMSLLTIESLIAAKYLKKNFNIECEIININCLKPINFNKILNSTKKTQRLLVLELSHSSFSYANEIIYKVIKEINLKYKPIKIGLPNHPVPTSYSLTKDFYPDAFLIVEKVLKFMNKSLNKYDLLKVKKELKPKYHDVPGNWFEGPF